MSHIRDDLLCKLETLCKQPALFQCGHLLHTAVPVLYITQKALNPTPSGEIMKKNFLLLCCLVGCSQFVFSQTDSVADTISQRIVLIGDAGQLNNGWHPVANAVKRLIPLDKKTTIIYLGDNLYKNGLPDPETPSYHTDRAVLDSQLLIADGTDAEVLMIPGNHDWQNGKAGGYEAIVRQQLYADFVLARKNIKFYPKDGCPGPREVSIGKNVTLIIFDSQWWLHPHDKPEIESDCDCKTKDELVTQIGDIAARNANKLIVVACHHPFKSNGIHGGYFTLKQHLFPFTDIYKKAYIPLPILGSIYPVARSVFGSVQDLKFPAYQDMVKQVTAAVKESAPNVVFVSGHDHNLQHIVDNGQNYIVSGGGCKISRTSNAKNSMFNSPAEGFGVMEVSTNKNVSLTFYEVNDTAVNKAYNAPLLSFFKPANPDIDSAATVAIEDPFIKYKDTVTVPASDDFKKVAGLKKLFMGENYRPEWATPVNMKVFNLKKEKGGLKITGLGGGKQTKSLKLESTTNGRKWVLRSLNKNPHEAIPENFRGTMAEELAMEMNSASHPYASLAIPEMARALNISTAKPELFFVPDDPALGLYRPFFANNVCILEERDATKDSSDTRTSAKLFDKMLEDNDHRPIQPLVLKARLLDIVIGDFDRHLDQWRWGTVDTGKGKMYYPIPRDRDQAFFYSDGLAMKIASGRFLPFLKGLRNDIPKINWLGYSARDFDRIFLTELDNKTWLQSIQDVQTQLSDSVIRRAILQMPKEVQAINGEKIISKLISRRNQLDAAMKYYRFVSRKVNVIGSNEKEVFKVSNHPDGLQVRVYSRAKGNDTSFIMYNRIFDASVTKEIRLYGLNDEDVFEVDKDASSRIKLRIIGGKGNDTFNIRGRVENLLYDVKAEGNHITDSSHSKVRFAYTPPVNDRNIFGFKYNTSHWPQLSFGYNADDGLLFGAGFSHRTYGFRNLPYATDQKLSALYAADRKAFQLKYRGEFNHITRDIDLLVKANYSSPALYNFFGWGNSTVVDENLPREYYQSRHSSWQAEVMLRKRFFDNFHFQFGPYFYSYQNKAEDNTSNIFGKYRQLGFDSASLFTKKNYAGGKLSFLLDNRNNELYPTRGMYWHNEFTALKGIKNSSDFMAYQTDMSVYASMTEKAGLVTILKFGGGRILSKNYEFFQAMNFGAANNLQGFRKNRFAGRSSMYTGIEFRLKLFDINSYILPGTFGISAFYDAGKVRLSGESSRKWHGAYGGGVFFMPFKMFIISASAGYSENEKNFNVTLGTKFNLTY
jgi:Calcineurin-like phosphoesterase